MRLASSSSPADLFDAAIYPDREGELDALGLQVVARPGMAAPVDAEPGDLLVRRALGESRLAVLYAVERVAEGRAVLEATGVACEGRGDGVFAEVTGGANGRRAAVRIAGPDGRTARDLAVFRQSRAAPARPSQESAEDTEAPLATLLAAVYAMRGRRRPALRAEYLRSVLEPSGGASPLRDELQRAAADLERRRTSLPAGPTGASALQPLLDEISGGLLAAAERLFILDLQRSTLELLDPAERDRYLGFAWQEGDFPGGPPGPNEARADQMFAALTRLRPERRANQGDTAAVRAAEFDDAMQARIQAALVPVPGEQDQRLHRDAAAAYEGMRTAAAGDGVTLAIGNSYRTAARAQASAARAGNRAAVAAFSSHTLGLAVDLNMSHGGLRFTETSTRPFPNLVDMYRSPVHKWMFLRGEAHGWFPYRREPWHWEYNPPGFRDRLRQTPGPAPAAAAPEAEGVNDPITPPRPLLSITGSVGRAGQNLAPDVRAVQARLVELRALAPTDAESERPPESAAATESSLPRTIDAIESFQRQMGEPVNGKVETGGTTRTDLDRAVPHPTAAELAAVATARSAIRESLSRGLTLTGPVGATATGNRSDDVRAVQRRLVELGKLSPSHGEDPPAGSGPVPPERLRATIAALRALQADVRFWVSRATVSGALAPGAVAPGDATATLLDRVSVYSMTSGPTTISFRDHVVSGATRSESGVMFRGTALPSAIPVADYRAQGLDAGAPGTRQAAALKFVSTQEGNFDAINTYDRALVSAGFIQFAGSRGLPSYLALLKARQPAKFRDLLQKLGIDVEFTVSRPSGTQPKPAITGARVVVLDPTGNRVLRGAAAEAAIRDDKRLTAALILSGRDRDVQLVQIEAAIRDYVRPAQNATVSWGGPGGARLGDLLRSQKGMAALFDRAIQEGLGAARRRFERVIQRLVRAPDPAARSATPPALAEVQRREGDVLAELERDLQAAADLAAKLAQAQAALGRLIQAASVAGAALPELLARPELPNARRATTDARAGLPAIVNVSSPAGVPVDTTLGAMTTTLTAEESRLALTPSPPSLDALVTLLTASRRALATVAGPVSTAPTFLVRIQGIRRSTLDSGLAEVA